MLYASDPDWTGGGAACVDSIHLHAPSEDITEAETSGDRRRRVTAALEVCQRCPMLQDCAAWTFRTRPGGTVSGGLDLTGQEAPDVADTDADIYMARIRALCEEAGITLTDYQTFYVEQIIRGVPERWQSGGSRPLTMRAQCEWLLGHTKVGFRKDRAG
ncbi:WhiB family transcriptional regulator [Aeromicrobium sp. WCS2018Hpa-33]|nr:WhiB family transcriptional regulator [Aeromicrobium sp. WCS2018Hpa-33]